MAMFERVEPFRSLCRALTRAVESHTISLMAGSMMSAFIPEEDPVVRRTISIPAAIEELVRKHARDGESFSAAIARLAETGARSLGKPERPKYIGSGEGPSDLGRRAEYYLRHPVVMKPEKKRR